MSILSDGRRCVQQPTAAAVVAAEATATTTTTTTAGQGTLEEHFAGAVAGERGGGALRLVPLSRLLLRHGQRVRPIRLRVSSR